MRSSEPLHPIAKLLLEKTDPFAVERLRHSIQRRRKRKRALRIATGVATCSIALALLAWNLRPSAPPQTLPNTLALMGQGPLPEGWRPPKGSRRLAFNDGSSIALEEGASIFLEQSSTALFVLRLERGETEIFVKPGGPRMWRVITEDLTITVLGTRFKVRKEPASSQVYVYQGKVMVEERASGRSSVLVAGDSINIPPEPTAPPVFLSPSPPPKPKVAPAPIKRTRRRKAPPQHSPTPQQLLRRSDQAKAAGDFAKAAALLEKLLNTASVSEEAPYAAYSLGVLRMDMLDQPKAAKAAFERALRDQRLPTSLKRLTQDRLKKLQ